ncbi:MAG: cation transporter [Deltaproteobacteria bacterium]|nr:cation transporter [Deltaproteobacteria bacterium]
MARTTDREVKQVLIITFLLNLVVCGAKLIYGFATKSLSLQADGFHSLLDSSSNIVGMIGVILASRPPDESHPYGHRKIETLAALSISFLLFATCYEITTNVVERIGHPVIPQVHFLSFLIMAVTVGVNLWVSSYEMKKGLKLKSDFLLADSMHTRSDVFVSLSVIGSFVAVLLNAVFLDIVIAAGIVLFIIYAAFRIMHRSLNVLLDAQPLNPLGIEETVMAIPGVLFCHKIRSRGAANGIFVDFHIHVEPLMTLEDAHSLTHEVIRQVKEKYPEIVDVVVHTEPAYLTKTR